MIDVITAAGLGFTAGYLAGRSDRLRPPGPARLTPLTRHAFKPAGGLLAEPSAAERLMWDAKLVHFAFAGDGCAFSLRAMRGGFCSGRTWEVYMRLLQEVGALEVRPRAGTRWAAGWSVRHLRLCLKHALIQPPYPAGTPPACGWRL